MSQDVVERPIGIDDIANTEADFPKKRQRCQVLLPWPHWTREPAQDEPIENATAGLMPYGWSALLPQGIRRRVFISGSGFSRVQASSLPSTLTSLSSKLSNNDLAQVFLKAVESILPNEPSRQLEVYQILIASLREQIIGLQRLTNKIEPESDEDVNYERHESPDITAAFLNTVRSHPAERDERVSIYTEEELNRF